MGNADGVVWVDRLGEGLSRAAVRVSPSDAERMLRLVAAEMGSEFNAQSPSLSAKLPPPWGARLQAARRARKPFRSNVRNAYAV